jgi:tRNA pseudouridine55 synthase
MEGFLLIDKPVGPTSHGIVNAVRRLSGEKRVGHAGTLDPFATGLLVVGVGRTATREFQKLVGLDKSYEGTLVLGATSDTQDGTGTITANPSAPLPTQEQIEAILPRFHGTINQTPPMYSAKKQGGKKLYELARAGKEVAREPVAITIHELRLISVDGPRVTIYVRCGSGTYIRTLAHDIGAALGCGAYLETLRRTSVGPWSITEATRLDALTPENIGERLIGVDEMLRRLL